MDEFTLPLQVFRSREEALRQLTSQATVGHLTQCLWCERAPAWAAGLTYDLSPNTIRVLIFGLCRPCSKTPRGRSIRRVGEGPDEVPGVVLTRGDHRQFLEALGACDEGRVLMVDIRTCPVRGRG